MYQRRYFSPPISVVNHDSTWTFSSFNVAAASSSREAIVLRHSSAFSSDPGLSFIRPDAYPIMPPSYFHSPLACHRTRGRQRRLYGSRFQSLTVNFWPIVNLNDL